MRDSVRCLLMPRARATRSLASLGLRFLHSALDKRLPPAACESLAGILSPATSSSTLEGRIDGGHEELWHSQTKLLDPEASSFGSLLTKDPFGSGGHLQTASPSLDRTVKEWRIDMAIGMRFSRGTQHWWSSESITEVHGEEAASVMDHDFFSMYLHWRSHDRSVRSPEPQNYPEAAADGLLSLSTLSPKMSFPHLLLSSSSLNFHQDPVTIIPLEASSVKRKRKKKMNKHKQRKLRRRDRHRN